MTPLDAAILIVLLVLPLHWLVMRYFDQLADPAYLRKHGVVILSESALQDHSEPIGQYRDRPIWGTVTFMGMVYRFHHIVDGRDRRVAPGELFLEPGLVYVTD
jgi:hypothetical protein